MAEHEPMLDMFIFETRQFLEQLEQLALKSEQTQSFDPDDVNEFFRGLHTIKGSAAMMMVNNVSTVAHSVEDIFFYIRERKPQNIDCSSITDLVLAAVDFMGGEIDKIDSGEKADASSDEFCETTRVFLRAFKEANGDDPDVDLRKVNAQKKTGGGNGESTTAVEAPPKPQQYFIPAAIKPAVSNVENVFFAHLRFEPDCGMEEVRAFGVINSIKDKVNEIHHLPDKILEDDSAAEKIQQDGFKMWFTTKLDEAEVKKHLDTTIFMESLVLKKLKDVSECEYWPSLVQQAIQAAETPSEPIKPVKPEPMPRPKPLKHEQQQLISVAVDKLDRLMDLVGELVIAEAMVTHNPDVEGQELENFQKASRQLHKVANELQDSVMELRMVPLEATFMKMNRIVRDMTKKLNKKAKLVLVGEDTEVDKNIIEHIGDPLMHIIRNSIDHGIEMPDVRVDNGKDESGTVTLSAENASGEVVIKIADDGAGLDREKILSKARANKLFTKPEDELTDKEIYSFIFHPGFSTNEKVTEFSGRGVGMDVVLSNIKTMGGTVLVDSVPGQGSITTLKIPLTLAIIECMSIVVGSARYTVPINSIRQSFRPAKEQIIHDPDHGEMIMVRGEIFPIVRLGSLYKVPDAETELENGILLLVEADGRVIGLFADRLLGVQDIVVKPVPKYIQRMSNSCGIAGCTILGDGSISLIIDAGNIAKTLLS